LFIDLGNPASHGFIKKEKKNEDCKTQTAQAHEGKPPQEAPALQVVDIVPARAGFIFALPLGGLHTLVFRSKVMP
jgi:hypothetical protein